MSNKNQTVLNVGTEGDFFIDFQGIRYELVRKEGMAPSLIPVTSGEGDPFTFYKGDEMITLNSKFEAIDFVLARAYEQQLSAHGIRVHPGNRKIARRYGISLFEIKVFPNSDRESVAQGKHFEYQWVGER